jgi:hypothetical protein
VLKILAKSGVDMLSPYSITLFEELIYDADPAMDLHLLIDSPGGDGEIAVRLVGLRRPDVGR